MRKTLSIRWLAFATVTAFAFTDTGFAEREVAGPIFRPPIFQHVIDFEDIPIDASLPNPLVIGEVAFVDPYSLSAAFCSAPTCLPDPKNPDGGNIVLFLNEGATIQFPPKTRVLLEIQGMGNNRFKLRLTDVSGRQHIYHGQGVSDQAVQAWLDVNKRITQIEVLKVGGTGGPLVISEMWLVFDPLR